MFTKRTKPTHTNDHDIVLRLLINVITTLNGIAALNQLPKQDSDSLLDMVTVLNGIVDRMDNA